MDALGQVTQVSEDGPRIGLEFDQGAFIELTPPDLCTGQAEFGHEGHQFLLGTIVDVPLDPPPLRLLSLHDPRRETGIGGEQTRL